MTIVRNLAKRHTQYAALSPELPGAISPFITSQELNAQCSANDGDASLPMALMRTQWGYIMQAFSNPTLIEVMAAMALSLILSILPEALL